MLDGMWYNIEDAKNTIAQIEQYLACVYELLVASLDQVMKTSSTAGRTEGDHESASARVKEYAIEINKLSPKVIVSNKLSIDALICLVSKVDLVIGADTGPTHFAWALNIPSIVLFGPTPGNRNTVVSETNQIIESKSRVNPYKIDRNDYSIKDIEVEEIINLSNKLLGES